MSGRTARAAGLVLLAVLVLYAGYRAAAGALRGPAGCGREDPLQGWLIAAVAVGAFGLGHLFARYRASRGPDPESAHPKATAILVQGMLAAFFLVVFLVLVYETAALLGVAGLEPITAYVRCARTRDPLTTALAAGVVSFLVGQWLWYPNLPPTSVRRP